MTQHIEEARAIMNKLHSVVSDADKLEVVAAWISIEAIFAAALAAAEERGRIEERERCAIETGGVLVEMPPHPPNLMARVLAYLEGSDPKATSGGERNSDLRDWVRKVLEASK